MTPVRGVGKEVLSNTYDHRVLLDPEQEELLADLVESARDVPREEQEWILLSFQGGSLVQGPSGRGNIVAADLEALAHAGAVRARGRKGNIYVLTPEGRAHYATMKQRQGEPMARQEDETRRLLDSEAFRSAYPDAHARWTEAEALLWSAQSEREFTTVGHKCREAMQEFATELVARYQPSEVDPDPAKVDRRLGAVIAMFLPSLGESRAALLMALGDYSEATTRMIQRQVHGGQKEGHALTWNDARRVVFHVASVMYELAVTLDEAEPNAPPPAHLEGG